MLFNDYFHFLIILLLLFNPIFNFISLKIKGSPLIFYNITIKRSNIHFSYLVSRESHFVKNDLLFDTKENKIRDLRILKIFMVYCYWASNRKKD